MTVHPLYFSLLAGLAAAGPLSAQTSAPVQEAHLAQSRLGSVVLDTPVKKPAMVVSGKTSPLGSIMLAQIPAQPMPVPGQNPNTIRPPGGRPSAPQNRISAGSAAPRTAAPRPLNQPPVNAAPQMNAAGPAANPAPNANVVADDSAGGDEELVDLQYPNVPMTQILLEYENLTGKKIIRDINVEAVTFTLETTGKLPKKKAIEFIEKSLLLNGYGFIPAGEDMVKFINLAAIKPGPEHPLLFAADKLPQNGEEICTYVHSLKYIDPEDLKKTLSELVPLHAYGVLTPLPNSRGIVVTENSNTIRYIISLLEHLDVEPSRTEKRSFQLTRSSAEDVAKALADILDLEGKGKSGGSSGKTATPAPVPQAPGAPNQPAAAPQTTGIYGGAPQSSAAPPKIVPIARTNRLMVIARPVDLDYIESLVEELDAAAEIRNFISLPLAYLQASEVLQILGDALARISDDDSSGGKGGGSIIGNTGNNQEKKTTGDFGSSNSNRSGLGSSSGFGGSGMGGGSSFGSGGGLQSKRESGPPQSLVLGKTLIIADPTQNEIFASGPPEHLETIQQIVQALDVRPQQVFLSVVIGQVKLTDTKDFGIDYLIGPRGLQGGNNQGVGAATIKNRVGTNQSLLDPSTIKLADLAKTTPTGISLYGTIYDNVQVVISALSTNSDFKVLSRPSVFTLNNEPASIETGQQIPVPASTYSSYNPNANTGDTTGQFSTGFQSNIQYMDVSLRLDVVPTINSKEDITLQIKQVNKERGDSIAISGNNIPTITNQGLETTVITKNNSTVLLGGLIREGYGRKEGGIPILRSIPLIKYLASSTENIKERSELLIFIQPRIVGGDGDLPNNYADTAGASPLGEESRRFFTQEKSDPLREEKAVKRSKIGQLLRKLFN